MRRRLWIAEAVSLLVAVVAGTTMLGAGAAHADGWLPTQTTGVDGRFAASGGLGVDSTGTTTMVNGFQGQGTVKMRVMSTSRVLGGGWAMPAPVLPGDQSPTGMRFEYDRHGNSMAAWSNFEGGLGVTIRTAWRASDGAWSPPEDISLEGDSWAFNPDIAFHHDGSATVIWSQLMVANLDEAGDEVTRVRHRSADGHWSAGVSLTPADGRAGRVPQLALAGDGTLYATWELYNASNDTWQIQVARQPDVGVVSP